MRSLRTYRCALALLWLALAASAISTPAGEPATDAEDLAEIQRLQREKLWLEQRIELAQEGEFCLLLDPAQAELSLTLAGVVLSRYPIHSLEIGTARIAFFHRSAPADWIGVLRAGGQLRPPRPEIRIEIQPPPPGAKEVEPPPIPPTAEEAVPAPNPFLIAFDGGPTLEVRSPAAGPGTLISTWHRWWIDKFNALAGAPESAVRVRVALDPADAAALYRSLPPNTHLLVLPPGSPADKSKPEDALLGEIQVQPT